MCSTKHSNIATKWNKDDIQRLLTCEVLTEDNIRPFLHHDEVIQMLRNRLQQVRIQIDTINNQHAIHDRVSVLYQKVKCSSDGMKMIWKQRSGLLLMLFLRCSFSTLM